MDDLRKAAEAEQLRSLPGLGAKTEERILKALEETKKPREKRTLLARALPAVQAVVEVLREHPASNEVSEAGSVRRRTETVKDLDIIATASDPAALTEYFTKLTWVSEIKAHGKTKATVVSHDGLVFDLRVVPPDSYGNLLQHFTGSKRHNVELREDAVQARPLGLRVRGQGHRERRGADRADRGGALRAARLRVDPAGAPRGRRRAGRGQRAASCRSSSSWKTSAATSTCTRRGRTTARTRSRRWPRRPRRCGYDYVAMTDHAHYLREGRLEAQWGEIAELNGRLEPFRILRGIEVSIRADGSLDMPDDVLAECDWVVASLHSAFDKSPTERLHGRDGEPARRLHRPHDRAEAEPARRRRHRARQGLREGGRDRDVRRDQLAAGPARSARHPRAGGGGGRASGSS